MASVAYGLHAYAEALAQHGVDPRSGLPDEVFGFALAITPMINVDLLVRDACGRLLWSWRDDAYGKGWHIPGGIIRVRERYETRIAEVARLELGASVDAEASPFHVLQLLDGERGHFISLLFRCKLAGRLEPPFGVSESAVDPSPGRVCWFAEFPEQVYPAHEAYRGLVVPER